MIRIDALIDQSGLTPRQLGHVIRTLHAELARCHGSARRRQDNGEGLDLLAWGQKYLPEHFRRPPSNMHRWLADFARRRSGRLRVTSESKVPYQLDGDPGGMLPLEIETVPSRLTLLVP